MKNYFNPKILNDKIKDITQQISFVRSKTNSEENFTPVVSNTWTYTVGEKMKTITLTDNITNVTLTGMTNSGNLNTGVLLVTQDSTGNRGFKINNTALDINPAANSTTVIGILYNGTSYIITSSYTPPTITYDTDAQNYFDRIATAGGSLTTTEKSAWNTWFTTGKTDGWFTKLHFFYAYCGGVDAARKLNAVSSSFTQTWIGSIGYATSGSYKGLKGDGSTGYAKTGYTPYPNMTLYNQMIGMVIAEATKEDSVPMGAYQSTTQVIQVQLYTPTNNTLCYMNSNAAHFNYNTQTTAQGVWVFSRLSNTDLKMYLNGTSLTPNQNGSPTDGGSLPNIELYIGARNNNNTTTDVFSAYTQRASYAGAGFTSANVTSFTTATNNLLTAIGH